MVILLDASLLATQYTNNFEVQTTYKTVVYSVKLKMEFTVLNSLLNVIRADPSTIEGPEQQGLVPHPRELTSTGGRSADVPPAHIHAESFSPNFRHDQGRVGVAKQEMQPGLVAESLSTRTEVRQPVLRHEDV
jgi:N-glycosylase/DNA lyase